MKSQFKSKEKRSIGKKILIVILVVILTLVLIGTIAYSRYLYPTGRIMPGIYAVRNEQNGTPQVNFFIMEAGEKYIAFDSGAYAEQTAAALQRLGISADDIIAVFITHSDYDHVGSLDLFDNAVIYSFDTEFRYAENPRFPIAAVRRDIPHLAMADGETVEIYGRQIQSVYTLGHTSDSISFLVDDKYLFVGDLLTPVNTARYDSELQQKGIERVLNIDSVEYVFFAHFGLFKDIRFFRWRWL